MRSTLEQGGIVSITMGDLQPAVTAKLLGLDAGDEEIDEENGVDIEEDVPLTEEEEETYQRVKDLDRVYIAPEMSRKEVAAIKGEMVNIVAERITRIEETRPPEARRAIHNMEALSQRRNGCLHKVADLERRLAETNSDKKRKYLEKKIDFYKSLAELSSNRATANFEVASAYYNKLRGQAIENGVPLRDFTPEQSKPMHLLEGIYELEDVANPPELRWNYSKVNRKYAEMRADIVKIQEELRDYGVPDSDSLHVRGQRNSLQARIRTNAKMKAAVELGKSVVTEVRDAKVVMDSHMDELLEVEKQQNEMLEELGIQTFSNIPMPDTNHLDELAFRIERQQDKNKYWKQKLNRR
ncbi:hypothetical protein BDR26DRAFT_178319 [Obelidium mucronatum]|nr:hypothetical protein BDR26DRAFT_178319 [Obelidium mucronatum]